MKICFVIPRIYAYFNNTKAKFAGGAERQAYFLAKGLSEHSENQISCCVADFGQDNIEIYGNITLYKSFILTENRIKGFKKLQKTLKNIDADIYIYRSADVGTAASIFFQTYFRHKKILYMVASNSETTFKSLKKMSGLGAALAMPVAYRAVKFISTQSQEQFNEFYLNRKRKPNGIVLNICQFPGLQKGIQNRNTVVWVGRLSPVKQPEVFIELAFQFPDIQFVMIAPIVAENRNFGEKIVSKIKKVGNIEYHSYVSPNNINSYYFNAKVYVITSYTEGFSNTMAEAVACGCPVLSLNVNPDKIITTYNFGFCAENSKSEFYHYFQRLYNNPELCKNMGKQGLEYLQKYHSSEEVLHQLKNLIG